MTWRIFLLSLLLALGIPSATPFWARLHGTTADKIIVSEDASLRAGHDPETGRALGNLPHLRAHVGLIGNALSLDGHL